MKKRILILVAVLCLTAIATTAFAGGRPGRGELYYNGNVVRTIVPPAKMKKAGIDPLFVVTNGVEGQRPVAAVGPGDQDYHGGKWKVYEVTWNDPANEGFTLTSGADVAAAEAAGLITVTRNADADFKCPIQP